MKNNYLLLLVACILASSSLFGQRLKDKRAQINYVSLPTKKVPDSYTTYSVQVYGSAVTDAGHSNQALENKIVMDGFKRVNYQEGGGHLRIVMNMGYTTQGRAEYKSNKITKKDEKTGVETVTWEYWYEVPLNLSAVFNIYDPAGNILTTYSKNFAGKKSTSRYSKSDDLSKNYNANINRMRKEVALEVINDLMREVVPIVSDQFDFDKRHDNPEFFIIENYPSEPDYQKYFELLDTEWKKIDSAVPTSELKAKFGPALAFYEKEAEIDAKGDKKLLKVFEAANYNAALLNFYLDDFEKAVRYANRVIASEGGKHRKSSDLIERVQKTKQLMDMHGVNTLHYARDLSNAIPPAAMKALEKAQEQLESDNNLLRGVIVIKGETIEGTVVSEKGVEELDFSDKGNTKFMDASKKEYSYSAKEIEAFSIGTRNFVKKNFAPCAKGKVEPTTHILEEIYTSDKIVLYKYYPSAGALSDAKMEFAFKKASDTDPISLYDTRFLILKKGLATYFSDCADLKAMCEQGEITNDQEGLLKAARIYAELCE
ncbi:MAG TPA: hypothetical protein PK198_03330 [Saprospiraceae bacterium]|nr:hypothetical protein [Saprospiraceae bacterium]HRF37797.1 hypothetical protein [Saprospiraceae bacterium]HRK81447.1 hypothetical protein [Saprospiraceae bacterium]